MCFYYQLLFGFGTILGVSTAASTVCLGEDFLINEEWTFHTSGELIYRIEMHIIELKLWNLHKIR